MSSKVFIGLGSNLNNPKKQVTQALEALNALPYTQVLKYSRLYQTQPVGPQDQPDFINAVALLETQLPPFLLLQHLQAIENKHQRVRLRHWGERTLDLDILQYDNLVLNTPLLTLPHPEMHKRDFVQIPLNDIL